MDFETTRPYASVSFQLRHAITAPNSAPSVRRRWAIRGRGKMLGLQLRDEFKGHRLKGTAIELTNKNNTGATQIPATDFLRITYPSTDLLKTLEAAGPNQGRPITLKGERGQGKSHLMGALHHA